MKTYRLLFFLVAGFLTSTAQVNELPGTWNSLGVKITELNRPDSTEIKWKIIFEEAKRLAYIEKLTFLENGGLRTGKRKECPYASFEGWNWKSSGDSLTVSFYINDQPIVRNCIYKLEKSKLLLTFTDSTNTVKSQIGFTREK